MRTAQGRALFGGVAAHPFRPLHYPMTSAIGLGILTAGHRHGWPVAEGGSASITTALAAMLTDLGGKIETGVPIQAASQLLPADATLFDLAPESVAAILADRLPPRILHGDVFGQVGKGDVITPQVQAGACGGQDLIGLSFTEGAAGVPVKESGEPGSA